MGEGGIGEQWEGNGNCYKRATQGIFVVLEMLCVISGLVDSQAYVCDKIAQN